MESEKTCESLLDISPVVNQNDLTESETSSGIGYLCLQCSEKFTTQQQCKQHMLTTTHFCCKTVTRETDKNPRNTSSDDAKTSEIASPSDKTWKGNETCDISESADTTSQKAIQEKNLQQSIFKKSYFFGKTRRASKKTNNNTQSDSQSSSKSTAKLKVDSSKQTPSISCEMCGKTFQDTVTLLQHKLTHSSEIFQNQQQYVGQASGLQAFAQVACLFQEKLSAVKAMNDRKNDFLFCTNSSDELGAHLEIRNGYKFYKCAECGKEFDQRWNLRIHLRSHYNVKPFSCDVCGKRFTHLSNMRVHKQTHTGIKPHACDICNKCFGSKANMLAHKQTHTNEKPHGCRICGKSFLRRSNLHMHLKIHTGEKPHSCTICGRGFVRKSTLNIHMKTHGLDMANTPTPSDKTIPSQVDQVIPMALGHQLPTPIVQASTAPPIPSQIEAKTSAH